MITYLPLSLLKLKENLKKLPGIGERSAERIIFFLLQEKNLIPPFIESLKNLETNISFCSVCHGITENDPCFLCNDPARNSALLCVVERPQDVWLLESTNVLKPKYHILGGNISPLLGVKPEDLTISHLLERIKTEKITEVILSISPTQEGDMTAYYIKDLLKSSQVKLTRIARGIPTGTDIALLDSLTLKEALEGRREF